MISDAIDYVVPMGRRPNAPHEVADIQRVVGWRENRIIWIGPSLR